MPWDVTAQVKELREILRLPLASRECRTGKEHGNCCRGEQNGQAKEKINGHQGHVGMRQGYMGKSRKNMEPTLLFGIM